MIRGKTRVLEEERSEGHEQHVIIHPCKLPDCQEYGIYAAPHVLALRSVVE